MIAQAAFSILDTLSGASLTAFKARRQFEE
jgi:hypothetical protein